MENTKIVNCTCVHESQDQIYGKNKRLANKKEAKANSKPDYKYTVCGKIHN
jgi:hypothetical protein